MSDNPHGPREAYLVIDGPLQGELRAHDNTFFEVYQSRGPEVTPRLRPAGDDELKYFRYWLRQRDDGVLVWSCEAPL